jgi:protein gp37
MTKIEWADRTWNPIVGCSRVTEGCDHCYAIGVVHRGMSPQHVGLTVKPEGERVDWTGKVRVVDRRMDEPLRRKVPTRYFVNSLSDLFHRDLPDEAIARVFAVMALAQQHTFQVLTKRPHRMARLLNSNEFGAMVGSEILAVPKTGPGQLARAWHWPLRNVWLGTSIESDLYDFRADHLRRTPAAVRFISAEPLLGPLPQLDLTGIDWLIVGGESGPGARPMHPQWVRDLRDRCRRPFVRNGGTLDHCEACGEEYDDPCPEHRVAFFFKQWGDWVGQADHPRELTAEVLRSCSTIRLDGTVDTPGVLGHAAVYRVGKKAAGRRLDGRIWSEMPEERLVPDGF